MLMRYGLVSRLLEELVEVMVEFMVCKAKSRPICSFSSFGIRLYHRNYGQKQIIGSDDVRH